MSQSNDVRRWVMVVCDFSPSRPVETYAGFCVVRLADDKTWTNIVARFYDGNPYADYDTAMAYADSVGQRVLQAAEIEDFWHGFSKETKVKRHG